MDTWERNALKVYTRFIRKKQKKLDILYREKVENYFDILIFNIFQYFEHFPNSILRSLFFIVIRYFFSLSSRKNYILTSKSFLRIPISEIKIKNEGR